MSFVTKDINEEAMRDSIFAQLTEMFGDVVSPDLISTICKTNDYELDNCIEQLICENTGSETYNKENKTENTYYNCLAENYQSARVNQSPQKKMDCTSTGELMTSQGDYMTEATSSNVVVDTALERNESSSSITKTIEQGKSSTSLLKLLSAPQTNSRVDCNPSSSSPSKPYPRVDFSSILKKGIKEFVSHPPTNIKPLIPQKRESSDSRELEDILQKINSGYKIMILMRGAPGCGKSFLARKIVDNSVKGEYRNHIFSTDDFFYDINDRYVYKPDRIQDAHEFNQKRVRKSATNGVSPIIVDNTNIKIWELSVYAKFAVNFGYMLEIIEPSNPWSHSAGKLATRNGHGVSKEKIERMLLNFEAVSVTELLRINHLKYMQTIPQIRNIPPLAVSNCAQFDMDVTDEKKDACNPVNQVTSSSTCNAWQSYEDNLESTKLPAEKEHTLSKPQRERNQRRTTENSSEPSDDMSDFNQLDEVEWKSYDEESNDFWQKNQKATRMRRMEEDSMSSSPEAKPQRTPVKSGEVGINICNILKEQLFTESFDDHKEQSSDRTDRMLEKHKIGCRNENVGFVSMRQIYPNKQVDGLWDLFEKCNGDVDWAIDILLKDDAFVDEDGARAFKVDKYFACSCDDKSECVTNELGKVYEQSTSPTNFKLPRQKMKKEKEKILSVEMQEAKRAVENQFRLGDEHYSSHVRKIRDLRHGQTNDTAPPEITSRIIEHPSSNTSAEKDTMEDDRSSNVSEEGSVEMAEINLGPDLIIQLESMFGANTGPKISPEKYNTNVFMPKNLAQQLYALWMESLYNQVEEQKQTLIKEDEEFARVLQDSQTYKKYPKPPNDYNEVLCMEVTWNMYKSEMDDWKATTQCDLATQLTKMKLCELFPDIERDTLMEVFAAHGYRFSDTVQVLKSSLKDNIVEGLAAKEKELIEKVKNESENIDEKQITKKPNYPSPEKKIISPGEAKKKILNEFEECRNIAAHHSQMRAECYQKAKEQIQKGNYSTAVFYSQIASLHKSKIDLFNHQAANCIMQVHYLNHDTPHLDLHYLHVMEAVQCLDIFIDNHIRKMRMGSRCYNNIFIITGRGLHSASGVSTIKIKVKARLRERNLKWTEVNPGLLKVKVFSNSNYSKNL